MGVSKKEYIIITEQSTVLDKKISQVEWSPDGQILAALSTGRLHAYLTEIPRFYATHGTKIIFLSSLREITFKDILGLEYDQDTTFSLEQDPTKIALGPKHFCYITGNQITIHRLNTEESQRGFYHQSLHKIKVNNKYTLHIGQMIYLILISSFTFSTNTFLFMHVALLS